jgi:hypothetical protein
MGNGIKTQGKLRLLELVDWSLQSDALWVRAKTVGDIGVTVE